MATWAAILAVGVTTFLLRASFILFADAQRFPTRFRQALAFVPPAVLAAIVLPGLLMPQGHLDLSFDNPRWIAGLVAIAAAWRLKSVIASIASGMAVLWLLQWAMR